MATNLLNLSPIAEVVLSSDLDRAVTSLRDELETKEPVKTLTYITREEGGVKTTTAYDWSGVLDRQKLIDVGLWDSDANVWRSRITAIKIGTNVTSVEDYAFENCSDLVSVTIPDTVTSIGDHAFCDCSSLSSVMIPVSVTNFGYAAFAECSQLTSMIIPDSVTRIEESAFQGCRGLTSMTIPGSVMFIGSIAFFNCDNLTSLVFQDKTMDQVNTMLPGPSDWGLPENCTISTWNDASQEWVTTTTGLMKRGPNHNGYSDWSFDPPTYNNDLALKMKWENNKWQPYTDAGVNLGIPQGSATSTELVWEAGGPLLSGFTATRTVLPGYITEAQSDKPLADADETATALAGKVNKTGDTLTGDFVVQTNSSVTFNSQATLTLRGDGDVSNPQIDFADPPGGGGTATLAYQGESSALAHTVYLPTTGGTLALQSDIPGIDSQLSQPDYAADAQAVGFALSEKASTTDVELNACTRLAEWTYTGVPEGMTIVSLTPPGDGNSSWMLEVSDGGSSGTINGNTSNPNATTIVFDFADGPTITATRTALYGYVLGAQDETPIASADAMVQTFATKVAKTGDTMTGDLVVQTRASIGNTDLSTGGQENFAVGHDHKFFGKESFAVHDGNRVGAKGFYWKAIDTTNKRIYLTRTQSVPDNRCLPADTMVSGTSGTYAAHPEFNRPYFGARLNANEVASFTTQEDRDAYNALFEAEDSFGFNAAQLEGKYITLVNVWHDFYVRCFKVDHIESGSVICYDEVDQTDPNFPHEWRNEYRQTLYRKSYSEGGSLSYHDNEYLLFFPEIDQSKLTCNEGTYVTSSSYGCTALGDANHVMGYNTFATGYKNRAEGNHSVAMGLYAYAEDVDSFVWGASGTPTHSHGNGSFTINPIPQDGSNDPAAGFFIGNESLASRLSRSAAAPSGGGQFDAIYLKCADTNKYYKVTLAQDPTDNSIKLAVDQTPID